MLIISSQVEPVHLVCTGQLTNAALLLTLFPEIKSKLAQVVIMGGGIGIGNTSPAAEFNIECDPEAAKIVFDEASKGLRLVMVPLEVTHTALCTPDILERIIISNTPFTRLITELLLFFRETYKRVFRFEHPPVHDPCAVFYVTRPDLFQVELMRVDIETSSMLCAGRTVCDVYQMSTLTKNVYVATKMDVVTFWDNMISAIESADAASCMNGNNSNLNVV
jgi:inosine-uridine nucleoside N-ribohydrolase